MKMPGFSSDLSSSLVNVIVKLNSLATRLHSLIYLCPSFADLMSHSALITCALRSRNPQDGSNHTIQASRTSRGWQSRVSRRRARATSLVKLRRESRDQRGRPDPASPPDHSDRNDDSEPELLTNHRRSSSGMDPGAVQSSFTINLNLPPYFESSQGCPECDSKHTSSQEAILHFDKASSIASNRETNHQHAPWRSINISVTQSGAKVEVSVGNAPGSPQSAAHDAASEAASAHKALESCTQSQPSGADGSSVSITESTPSSSNNILSTGRDSMRTANSSSASIGNARQEIIQSSTKNNLPRETCSSRSHNGGASGDIREQGVGGLSVVEPVLEAALSHRELERLCLGAGTLELWEKLPGVVMLIAMQRDDGYELEKVLTPTDLDDLGAGSLCYQGWDGEMLQLRAHHGLLFKTLPGTGPQLLRLALIQSMTPDSFDLGPHSRRHLDILEPDSLLMPPPDRSPLASKALEIVHSSIIVVDPLVPSRILHHQAHPLSIRDVELLHVKLRLQSLGAHPALASDDIPADSLLGVARDQEGLRLLPWADPGEHWHWSALEALSRSTRV